MVIISSLIAAGTTIGTATVLGVKVGLGASGFTSAGITAGSVGASMMSSVGIVKAGSLIAGLQSAGTMGLTSLIGPVGIPAGIVGGIIYAFI